MRQNYIHIYIYYHLQSSLAITLSPGGIFWDRVISEARYRFCRQGFFFFFFFNFFFNFFFFNLVYIFWLQIALSLCTLPRCTFTTHYVYCIFIRICFIALSKRNQNRCPKQVGFCLCSASHWRRSMTELAKLTSPLALCCLRSVIKVSVSKAICSQKIYTRFKKKKKKKLKKKKKKNLAAKKSGGTTDRVTADRRYNGARYSEAWLYISCSVSSIFHLAYLHKFYDQDSKFNSDLNYHYLNDVQLYIKL